LELSTWESDRIRIQKDVLDGVTHRARNYNRVAGIQGVVKRKTQKYPKEVRREMVLLVTDQDSPSLYNEDALKSECSGVLEIRETDFMGLYYVLLPSSWRDGQVVEIKNCGVPNQTGKI
jgi:hypothetical protein